MNRRPTGVKAERKALWSMRTIKRANALTRQSLRNTKTDIQQLAELDSRLGVGAGAKKERQRLTEKIFKSEKDK